MLKSRKTRIHLIAAAIGMGALLIPISVSVSPGQDTTVEITEACADGTCCPEIGSTCDTDDGQIVNRYSSPTGCSVKQQSN